jgi:FkbM family methyltransferase
MKTTKLPDGTRVYALRSPEARMLDHHVDGYLQNGIEINDGDVVFDVGANIGVFSVRAAQKGPNVRVFAFEPIPDILEALKMNAAGAGQNRVEVLPCGVSNEESEATFTYFPNTPALSTLHPEQWDKDPKAFGRAVKGTMKNPPAGMRWMKFIPPMFSGIIASFLVKGKKQVHCKLRTLSSVIAEHNVEKIDLLKIDCEGAEWQVLQGISASDWPKIKSMVIEVHNVNGRLAEVESLLREKGFTKIVDEREKGLEDTVMHNIFALR